MPLTSRPQFLVVHPTGNTYVRHDVQALHEAGQLWRYFTGVGVSGGSAWLKIPGIGAELARRAVDLPSEKIQARPGRELVRLIAPRVGARWLGEHETGWASVDAVFQDLDRAAATLIARHARDAGAVLAYEDGAEACFSAAQKAGWTKVYHLPIAYGPYARKIFREEAARLPDWAPTLQGDRDSPAKLARKERELALADVVICPSNFVLDSLPAEARRTKACRVVPYGAPEIPPAAHRPTEAGRPLRLLFAGALSQRKGLADVFAAMKLLGCPADLELVLLGRPCAPWEFYRAQGVPFTYEAPRANAGVLKLMETCDALVLPSLVEGRAIVQLEALSRGLPLLVTPNAGGDDLVVPGETGFMVPIRQPAALAEKMDWLRHQRAALPEMRAACRRQAEKISWAAYRRQLLAALGGAPA
ncbi:MAG TPA: glycosyltransferase family 4 protein [Opitutales bacterium]|nr:glycosyltransferase family 4 protein [Opitutales bacterium]